MVGYPSLLFVYVINSYRLFRHKVILRTNIVLFAANPPTSTKECGTEMTLGVIVGFYVCVYVKYIYTYITKSSRRIFNMEWIFETLLVKKLPLAIINVYQFNIGTFAMSKIA